MAYGLVERAIRAELASLLLPIETSATAAALVQVARQLDRAKGAARRQRRPASCAWP